MNKTSGNKKKLIVAAVCLAAALILAVVITFIVIKATLIDRSEAESAALGDAGFKVSQVSGLRSELDFDDGFFTYQVDFYVDGVEYEYEIRAKDGDIISRDIDGAAPQRPAPDPAQPAATTTTLLTDNSEPAASEEPAKPADTVPEAENGIIAPEEAKAAALADAGIAESDVTFTKTYLDRDDGVQVYDVEFYTADSEYDYEISAADGSILSRDVEKFRKPGNTDTSTGIITSEEAKAAALADAGLAESDVTFTKTYLDRDDGVQVYDVEFYTADSEYDYEISAADGSIVSRDVEKFRKPGNTGNSAGIITPEEAKAAALADAGLADKDVTFTKTYLDRDDGVQVYDVEFYTADSEYDYEISAAEGKVLSKDVEKFRKPGNTSSSGDIITEQEARAAALKDAGLAESDVTFTKSKLDRDDGIRVYEIEFYNSQLEYEYEINAENGSIISRDVDNDR